MSVLISTIALAIVELALVLTIARLAYVWLSRLLTRAAQGESSAVASSSRSIRIRTRNVLIVTCLVLSVVVVVSNAWLLLRGVDAWRYTTTLLEGIDREAWIRFGVALGKLIAATILFLVSVAVMRRLFAALEEVVVRSSVLADHDKPISAAFLGLNYAIVNTGWLLLIAYAFKLFAVPDAILGIVLTIIRAYVVVSIGLLLIRSSAVIVDTLDAFGQRYVRGREWQRYYDHLRALVPTFRACLEYALWVAIASIALAQFAGINSVVGWAPKLIEGIALFFLGRVVIELGLLEIGRRMLPDEGLDDMSRRRRATMAPIVRSTYIYAVYFGTAVLILASLGFNPMPFLAGAGILGLVVGFGAQALINDVVSGFFILFENTYLVGDAVEAAGAKGVVEAIEFRTTKIRDADGRLNIIRNGDVKQVINYSKEYALAVVAVDVTYQADLPQVFAVLREAGEGLRRENGDVVGETKIDGISAFGLETMTVRTSTKVKPGRHDAAAAALRLAIKQAFDRRSFGTSRRRLVPEGFGGVPSQVQEPIMRVR
jgi:small conductance mechanosensitive channel